MENKKLPYCTVQFDADGLWVINKLLNRSSEIDPDPVFERGIEKALSFFDELGIRATFFIVAKDLKSESKKGLIKRLAGLGHEIACHGMEHAYLNSMTDEEVYMEIVSSKKLIETELGITLNGFKAPGFAANRRMVKFLEEAHYDYDSSVFGSLAAFAMQLASGVVYDKKGMTFAPNRPYRPSRDNIFKRGTSDIVEIPVTVLPVLRLPMHFSYAALGGKLYSSMTRMALKLSGAGYVNYLFHPLDFLDRKSIGSDARIYGIDIAAETKLSMAGEMIRFLKDHYEIMTTKMMCEKIRSAGECV
jgi:peptidoglycan/xylan/chitin deacetylase (PgdA/CDA1 family)